MQPKSPTGQEPARPPPHRPTFAEPGDLFGWTVDAGSSNGDSITDLVIGVPGQSIDGTARAGAVRVFSADSIGLSATRARPNQVWSRAVDGVDGLPVENAELGFDVAG